MRPLRAFLMLWSQTDGWQFEVFRDLEALEKAWYSRDHACTGVLHVGFVRPDESGFAEFVASHPTRLLLTDAARFALPRELVKSVIDIGSAHGQRVYLVHGGWGYEIEAAANDRCSTVAVMDSGCGSAKHPFSQVYESRPDWLASLRTEAPTVVDKAYEYGVIDEASYLALESRLPDELRENLGWSRYVFYSGLLPCADSLLRNLRFAPPWFLDVRSESLDLSVRSLNGLKAKSIVKVGDIAELGADGLRAIDDIGRKSFAEIAAALLERFAEGPWVAETEESIRLRSERFDAIGTRRRAVPPKRQSIGDSKRIREGDVSSALEALQVALSSRRDRSRQILEMRMGRNGSKQTLEQVGRLFGLTRERARQVEKRECDKIAVMPVWRDLSNRIDVLLASRALPLPLEGLEILDPWFKDIDKNVSAFTYVLKAFCGGRHSLVTIGESTYISAITQSQWDRCVAEGKEIVAGFVGRRVAESAVRVAIDGLLTSSGAELRDLLWADVTSHAHFSGPDGYLVSAGLGVQHAVEAVLVESDRPLHYSEITKRCIGKLGRSVELRRAHSAAAAVGLLFGRGIYGLRSHLPLSDHEVELVMRESEDVVLEPPHRQWHASEIVAALQDRGFELEDKLNSYLISIVLRDSELVTNLKRSVWVARSTGAQGANDRIDVAQAVHGVLIEAGRPLTSAEIRERVSLLRGVSSHFQIHSEGDVVRIGPGMWGLASRDVSCFGREIDLIRAALTRELNRNAQGIHISEVRPLLERLSCIADASLSPETIVDLATRDGHLRMGRGQYLYIGSWESPRRPTLAQAVKMILEVTPAGLSTADLERQVSELLGREVSMAAIASALSDIGADFAEDAEKWAIRDEVETEEALSS